MLVAGATALTMTPAYAGTASFGGTVTDSVTGDPVSGACVFLWKEEGDTSNTQEPVSCTEADGQWSYSGLDAGTYYVEVNADGYVHQFAYGQDYSWDATRFTVADGDSTTVDLALEPAGSIAGTITDAQTGDPVEGACAQPEGATSSSGCSGSDGTYVISGLRAGSYVVSFYDFNGGYIGEYAHDATDYSSATQFEVVAGQTTTVDEDLAPAARISGTITDATSGDPLAGACVVAMHQPEADETFGYACSDDTGAYVLTGLSEGTYYVAVDDDSGAHPRTWYPSTTDPAAATSVTANAGAETSGVDVALSPAAYLSGTVTRASTGEPLAEACVYAYRASDGVFLHNAYGCTDADGHYTVGALPTGNVKVLFSPWGDPNLLQQWAYGQPTIDTAAVIAVTAGETTTGVDAALTEGGVVTGRITDAKTKKPVEGACATVGVYSHRAGENGTQWPSACTGPDGRYEMRGLPTGSYTVEFYDPDGTWAWQFYSNKDDRLHATKVAVTAGATRSGIDAKLVPGGRIVGLLTDSTTGLPASGVCVDAFTGKGHDTFGTTAQTFGDGRFELRGFPTTKVKVFFGNCDSGYADEWAYDKTSYETANLIGTTAGKTQTVNATVTPG